MELEEKRDHAARLLSLLVQDPEYSLVYEDDDLSEEDEDVQLSILDLIASATVTVSWPDSEAVYTVAGETDE